VNEQQKSFDWKTDTQHTWQLDEKGKTDYDANNYDHHSGPVCSVCGYSFCFLCYWDRMHEIDKECEGE
jgi:MOSC domain-containing protein YiiM